jgi:uncharacterized heparinase superfamily protein
LGFRRQFSRAVALFRYHRLGQFGWRLYRVGQRRIRRHLPANLVFRSGRRAATWKPDARSAFARIADRRLRLWPARSVHASACADGRFTFLNQTRDLNHQRSDSGAEIDWNPDAPRLWRFHLQCHEFLVDLADQRGPDAAYSIVSSWLADPRHRSPTLDPDAWHPFCISRRLPVWMSLASIHAPPDELEHAFWTSVADQVQWLGSNCEWDLGGNHLLENLTALYLTACYLDSAADGRSLASIEARLLTELDTQILGSGEHYERAPTYHGLMTVCVLMCAEAATFIGSEQLERFRMTATKMRRFADWIRQPDGNFPLLGDSVLDETPDLGSLSGWAEVFSHDAVSVDPAVDYWSSCSDAGNIEDGNRLLLDTGPLACDHLPAHGHADLFQITATLGGRNAIVDTGNFEYQSSATRQRCRASAAHNVMQLGTQDHCDLWSSFRMGRRGHPVWKQSGDIGSYRWCAAAHDAYGCSVGRVVFSNDATWIVLDWFDGYDGETVATSRLHWHPDWKLTLDETSGNTFATRHACLNRKYQLRCLGNDNHAEIDAGIYCPNFGEKYPIDVLVNRSPISATNWLGYLIQLDSDATAPVPTVRLEHSRLEVWFSDRESLTIVLGDGLVIGGDQCVGREIFQ